MPRQQARRCGADCLQARRTKCDCFCHGVFHGAHRNNEAASAHWNRLVDEVGAIKAVILVSSEDTFWRQAPLWLRDLVSARNVGDS